MLAGPSEVLVIADATADVDTVAADLLAQVRAPAAQQTKNREERISTNTHTHIHGSNMHVGVFFCLILKCVSCFSLFAKIYYPLQLRHRARLSRRHSSEKGSTTPSGSVSLLRWRWCRLCLATVTAVVVVLSLLVRVTCTLWLRGLRSRSSLQYFLRGFTS